MGDRFLWPGIQRAVVQVRLTRTTFINRFPLIPSMDIGQNIHVDGSVTATGKLRGGGQAESEGDAVLLNSAGKVPADKVETTVSGTVGVSGLIVNVNGVASQPIELPTPVNKQLVTSGDISQFVSFQDDPLGDGKVVGVQEFDIVYVSGYNFARVTIPMMALIISDSRTVNIGLATISADEDFNPIVQGVVRITTEGVQVYIGQRSNLRPVNITHEITFITGIPTAQYLLYH